jgi:hypothetical protein
MTAADAHIVGAVEQHRARERARYEANRQKTTPSPRVVDQPAQPLAADGRRARRAARYQARRAHRAEVAAFRTATLWQQARDRASARSTVPTLPAAEVDKRMVKAAAKAERQAAFRTARDARKLARLRS